MFSQVLKLKLELVAHLTRNSKFSKRSAEYCLPDIVDKLGDAKNGGIAKECLTGMAEALGLDFISLEVSLNCLSLDYFLKVKCCFKNVLVPEIDDHVSPQFTFSSVE